MWLLPSSISEEGNTGFQFRWSPDDDVKITGGVGLNAETNTIAAWKTVSLGTSVGDIVGAEFEDGIAQSEGRHAAGGHGRGSWRGFRGRAWTTGSLGRGAGGRTSARAISTGLGVVRAGPLGRRSPGVGLVRRSLGGGVEKLTGSELFRGERPGPRLGPRWSRKAGIRESVALLGYVVRVDRPPLVTTISPVTADSAQ
jgi:hypothetical protein